MEDLEEAVETARSAVAATLAGHPNLAKYLNNLRMSLRDRYSRIGAVEDFKEVIKISPSINFFIISPVFLLKTVVLCL